MRTDKWTEAEADGRMDRGEEANRSCLRLNANGPKNGHNILRNLPPVPLANFPTKFYLFTN